MRRAALVAWVGVSLAGLGCDGDPTSDPPEIAWGVDECSRCHMILVAPRDAAAARHPAQGEQVTFDDTGELLLWWAEKDRTGWRAWASDEQGNLIPVERAAFVRSSLFATPMGSGVVAFSTVAAARSAAPPGAVVQRWAELRAQSFDPVTHPVNPPRPSTGDSR